MHNTIETVARGFSEWGTQGNIFFTTRDPRAQVLDEEMDLEELYGGQGIVDTIDSLISRHQIRCKRRLEAAKISMDSTAVEMMKEICKHSKMHVSDQKVQSTRIDDECEREIEQERELEKEKEIQIPQKNQQEPRNWDVRSVFSVEHPNNLPNEAGVLSLAEATKVYFQLSNLKAINWLLCDIYVTRNFLETVGDSVSRRSGDLDYYMRLVDTIVIFHASHCCLLLSEWEADELLHNFWDRRKHSNICSPNGEICFVNLSFFVEAANSDTETLFQILLPGKDEKRNVNRCASRRSPGYRHLSLSEHTVAGLQLLSGQTVFPTKDRKKALVKLLESDEAKKSALGLVSLRGLQKMIPRSDLEDVCSRV